MSKKLSPAELKIIFEAAYLDFHSKSHAEKDPVRWVHHYENPLDQEVAGLISALLAYGNVQTILKSIQRALEPMGASPSAFLRSHSPIEGVWKNFRHRFTVGSDLEIVLSRIRFIYSKHATLEDFFVFEGEMCLKDRLSSFVRRFHALPLSPSLRRISKVRDRQLRYLISDPMAGSACKRLNLFLRWMVRPADAIDLGIWKRIKPSELYLPIDTHLLKTIQRLKWTKSKSATWAVVEIATAKLRELEQNDPIRYDFSLCHLSMNRGSLPPQFS